jgi:hypothetical protein
MKPTSTRHTSFKAEHLNPSKPLITEARRKEDFFGFQVFLQANFVLVLFQDLRRGMGSVAIPAQGNRIHIDTWIRDDKSLSYLS